MTGSFAQTGMQALRRADSTAADGLGARYEMSIGRTMTLAGGAMENWPRKPTSGESPIMKNTLLWPVEFDLRYPRSANLPIFTKL